MDTKALGARIREQRMRCGLTQAELAQEVDMSVKHIGAIECGMRMPRLEVLVSIANALHTDANTLLVDVLKMSSEIRCSELWEKIEKLNPQMQRKIIRVIDAFLEEDI